MWAIIGGGNTQTLLADKKIFFEFYAISGIGDTKTFSITRLICSASPSTRVPYEPPGETLTNFFKIELDARPLSGGHGRRR